MFYKKGKTFMLLLAAWIFLATPAQGGIIFDNFDNNLINSSLWNVLVFGEGPSISEANKRLEITIPSAPVGTFVQTELLFSKSLVGDFDIQVDFNLLIWPAGNGIRMGINIMGLPFYLHRVSFGPSEGGLREEYYVYYNGELTEVTTTDTAGKLRIRREGNKVDGFYWKNNAWTSIIALTSPSLGVETEISIGAWSNDSFPSSFSGAPVTVAFDNFRVTNQYIGNSLPLSLLLD